jgi:hypothetical protein
VALVGLEIWENVSNLPLEQCSRYNKLTEKLKTDEFPHPGWWSLRGEGDVIDEVLTHGFVAQTRYLNQCKRKFKGAYIV